MKIGTIKGIKIKLHFSTLLIVALVGFSAAFFYLEYVPDAPLYELLLVGIINGIFIIFSILIHELAHSLMALRYGINVSEIELYLFGGVSKMEEEPKTPKSELVISIVGPLSSFILGIICLVLLLFPIQSPMWLRVTLFYSGITNIGLGIFNLLPAFPMDGGRVLRAFLWNKRKNILSATKTASKVGRFCGYSLMVLGFIQMVFVGIFAGFWLVMMGSFLSSAAKKSYEQTVSDVALSSISVNQILLGARKFVIPYELPLIEALRNYFMIFSQIYFPIVGDGGDVVGILHLEDIKRIPMELRYRFIVGDVMNSISDFPVVYEEDTGKELMKKLLKMEKKPYIAMAKERETENVLGFISESDIVRALKLWELNVRI